MRIFVSAGEPSGDLHGSNLVRALQRLAPEVECVGFGGDLMERAGCRLLYPLCQHSVMGFTRVLANLPRFLAVLSLADRYFRHHRPDALVLIDYPGLHWWLARRARFHGIPVFYFVPPQIWAWADWRVEKMRRHVDHVLCTLPFEKRWYEERGVPATYIGHPFFDAVRARPLDAEFMAQQYRRGGRIIGLLPGSRNQEVAANFGTLKRTAELLAEQFADLRFLVACYKPEHRARVLGELSGTRISIEAHVGKTPEIIRLAEACIAVSGSVSLEMMHHATPAVITYRVGRFTYELGKRLLKVNSITLVNLLAGKTLYPEYVSTSCNAEVLAKHVRTWLTDPLERQRLVGELRRLNAQVGQPGACERAARYVLDALARPAHAKLAA
ncbi:MAG: lipid-A-disaccharide synthase [Gemmatales bacterium]|nr:lipid-A-disaccharide synthase [Gemmatales bacterium]MDW8387251.1 lipid-A-disaccharide synthase [Gemmatales bacterium]